MAKTKNKFRNINFSLNKLFNKSLKNRCFYFVIFTILIFNSSKVSAETNEILPFQYALFPEESCTLLQLKTKANELRENNFTKSMELQAKIKRQFKRYIKLTGHDFSFNLAEKRLSYLPNLSFYASDVSFGRGRNYLLFALPRSSDEASVLFDLALQKRVTLFVSLLESQEAKSKFNTYWTQERLCQLTTKNGWRFAKKSSKILGHAPIEPKGKKIPKLIETKFIARHASGEKRELTHLHLEGWRDREETPNETLFHLLQDRIQEIHQGRDEPIAINCLGGVGRTGTTSLVNCLRKDIDDYFAQGLDPAVVKINVVEKLFQFRLQRNWFLEQAGQLANVFSVLGDYVKMKIQERKALDTGDKTERKQIISSYDAKRQLNASRKVKPLPSADSDFFQFKDQKLKLCDLKEKIAICKQNDLLGFEEISDKIDIIFNQFVALKTLRGKKYNFRKFHSIRRLAFRPKGESLNASDVTMDNDLSYLLFACPKSAMEAALLFDAAFEKNITLFVSTLNSTDAPDRFNNFWQEDKISQIVTPRGWKISQIGKRVLATSAKTGGLSQQIVETTLQAELDDETLILTHLHFDGWNQDEEVGDPQLLKKLLDRIQELHQLQAPIAVGSKWGVGRNGVTVLSNYLRKVVNDQISQGVELDQIEVNVPKAIYEFRKQRANFVEHPELLATVYEALLAYYEDLIQHQRQNEKSDQPLLQLQTVSKSGRLIHHLRLKT